MPDDLPTRQAASADPWAPWSQWAERVEARVAALEAENVGLQQDILEITKATRCAVEALAEQRELMGRDIRDEVRKIAIECAKLGGIVEAMREQGGAAKVIDPPSPLRREVN
jgi:hypothetical protein